jgi:hypothetical protein
MIIIRGRLFIFLGLKNHIKEIMKPRVAHKNPKKCMATM